MEKRQGFGACQRPLVGMAVCFIVLPVLFIVIPGVHQNASFFDVIGRLYKPHPVGGRAQNLTRLSSDLGFEEKSCLSRLQSGLYRKSGGTQRKPSAYLLSKLGRYEALHRRCGPYTEFYNRTMELIGSGDVSAFSSTTCKYLVWHPVHGMGNRIVSLASTFLYALLTDRVLLADLGEDMADLFCEPFLGSSWVLPLKFPLKNRFRSNAFRFAHSVGSALKNGTVEVTEESPEAPSFLFLNLYKGIYADADYCFYCDESQAFLLRVPWLIMLSDQYFMPSFFLIPSFKQEASKLFPEKDAVFYHLVHYLVHPSNEVWELITRFYEANLGSANERIGLQVRLFKAQYRTSSVLTDQILACLLNQTLLPEIDNRKPETSSSAGSQKTKAVLITSLYPQFYQNLSTMYSNKPTVSGEVIRFYQPSHEEKQKFGDSEHNMKALVEIYLLSMCDKLVISSKSTFGYVAQALGDTRAWILRRPGHGTDAPCVRDLSTEPCFHYPPFKNCNAAGNNNSSGYVDVAEHVPYLKHCEDQKRGVKLVDVHQEL